MKITQDEFVDRQTVLRIELEDADLSPYLDRGYRRVVQQVSVPGFRKGKAPRQILETYVGRESLLNEVLDVMLSEVTQRAIEEQGLETVGLPKLEFLGLDPFSLNATVALAPRVELGSFRDIRVEDIETQITEEDVQEELQRMAGADASWEPVERSVQLGDMVTMSVVGSVDGIEILNEKDNIYIAEEGGVLPFPGFAESLEGLEVGEPKEFDLAISEDYADAALAGKEVHFSLTVSEVKEQETPELDDEFAKSAGDGFDSLEALRESVQSRLNSQAEEASSTRFREASLDELINVAEVEMPPLLIDHEVEHMVARRDQFVERLKITKEDYLRFTGKTEEEIREEMKEEARSKFARSYALLTLAEEEGLDVSEEEIDDRKKAIRKSVEEQGSTEPEPDLDSSESRGSIQETLLVGKAMDRLTAIAKGETEGTGAVTVSEASEKPNEAEGGEKGDADA